jgi:hypothetical protein
MIPKPIARLFGRAPASLSSADAPGAETLVADVRNGVTPAQMVDRRLLFLLHGTPVSPVRGEILGPRRALCYAAAGDETQPGRQRIRDRGSNLGTPSAP